MMFALDDEFPLLLQLTMTAHNERSPEVTL
jgi:hypothetical protein